MRDEADDILIVVDGYITDTSFCNVVLANDEGLFTPDLPLLKGTQRAFLIDEEIIRPRAIHINDLQLYHKVKLINAMIGLDNPSTHISIENIAF